MFEKPQNFPLNQSTCPVVVSQLHVLLITTKMTSTCWWRLVIDSYKKPTITNILAKVKKSFVFMSVVAYFNHFCPYWYKWYVSYNIDKMTQHMEIRIMCIINWALCQKRTEISLVLDYEWAWHIVIEDQGFMQQLKMYVQNGTRRFDVIQIVVILQVNYTFSSKLTEYAVKHSDLVT